jgi:hypothetical protein
VSDPEDVRIEPIVGRKGDRPLRPFVACEIDTWLSPRRARRLARRLSKAADDAEALFAAEPTAPASDGGHE